MGQMVYVLGLLFIARIISSSAAEQHPEKGIRKSSLILEYNWPEPSKSLSRLPHPRSCHHFIHTKHDGSHVIKRCHGDQVFDYRNLRCQNKHLAKCWMNIVKEGNTKKVKQHFTCPFLWGLYPDKEDCSLFYNCMGGKVYPRKCPESTLFDIVERICVHSRKALCAEDADSFTRDKTTRQSQPLLETTTSKKEDSSTNIITTIISKSAGIFGIDSEKRRPEEENSSEFVDVKYRTKSKNKSASSKLSFVSTTAANPMSFGTRDVNTKEDSSEEKDSSEEVGKKDRTKSKNKLLTSKLSFSTNSVSPKSFRTTGVGSKEGSSEEDDSSEEAGKKDRTKSKNNFLTSKLTFSTNTVDPKSFRTTDVGSKDGSSKTPKIQTSSGSSSKEITDEIIPISTIMPTEMQHITSSSHDGHFSELPFQSSTIKSSAITENKSKPDIITMIPEVSKEDGSDINKMSWSTEIISKELTSSAEPFSKNKITDSTTNISFSPDSSTNHPKATETIEIESETVDTLSTLCTDSDGFYPHPRNKHLFIACIAGKPTIMKCPEKLVYDSNTASCVYDKI